MAQSDAIFNQYSKPVLVGVGTTFTVLPIIIVGLRFYARHRTRAAIGIDDWVILFALVLCTGGGVLEILAAEIGSLGQHQPQGPGGILIHSPELTNYEKCRYSLLIITTLNLGVIKTSILLFYRRLFTVRPFIIASTVLLGIVAAWTASFTSGMVAQCSPPSYFWESFEIDYAKHCILVQPFYQGLAISDLILDVLVLALPIPMVVTLNLPWKKKIEVLDIFLLGIVVLGSGIARVVSFQQVVNFTQGNAELYFMDTPYYTGGPLFWLFAENSIAIIGACLPTLAPLWRTKSSKGSSYNSYPWKRGTSNPYDNLEGQKAIGNSVEDDSVRNLVNPGPATQIHAEEIALEARPQNGIQVNTTLSTNTTKRAYLE